jgi:adenosylcobinamide-GDP ribazoletransferase
MGGTAMIRRLRAAFGFLTVIPARSDPSADAMVLGLPFFPLVGLAVGAVAGALAAWLVPHLGRPAGAAIGLLLEVALTRNLHWDGLFDTIDGLVAFPREKSLAAMRDPRIGGAAAMGGGLCLLLFIALAVRSPAGGYPLLFAAAGMAGRGAMALALALFPYARREGLGQPFAGNSGAGVLVAAATLLVLVAMLRLPGLIAAVLALLLVLLGGRYAVRRFGGFTGDIYGAVEVLTEILVLLTSAWR